MDVIITIYGTTILRLSNMSMLPKIGEEIRVNRDYYRVKDVIWHIDDNTYIHRMYVEIQIKED